MTNKYHATRGFTLLEAMISMFLLSITLLGVTAAEIKALREARGILYFNRAELFAQNMVEFMRAYDGDASLYYSRWQSEIQQNLPSAMGNIIRSSSQRTIITINWGGADQPCLKNRVGISGCVILEITA